MLLLSKVYNKMGNKEKADVILRNIKQDIYKMDENQSQKSNL